MCRISLRSWCLWSKMRKAMISRLCSWFLFNYCDQHTMSWGNIMKLFHIAFFFSKFKPNSNWELMLSPVIRSILLLSLEFRNTDRVSTGQCQPVHICNANKQQWSTAEQCSSSEFLIFWFVRGVIPGCDIWYLMGGGGGGGVVSNIWLLIRGSNIWYVITYVSPLHTPPPPPYNMLWVEVGWGGGDRIHVGYTS